MHITLPKQNGNTPIVNDITNLVGMAKEPHTSNERFHVRGVREHYFTDNIRVFKNGSNSTTRTQHGCCFLIVAFCLVATSIVHRSDAGLACLSNPCVYGVCIDDLNSTYSCYCIDGYTGVHCQTNWDECWSGPCLNGGTCIDGVASYNCTCLDGFLGLNCEENYNECQSNPCQHGGLCHDKENAFYCSCAQGYEGDFCEVDIAVCGSGDRCKNGAACIEGPGIEFSCRCTQGYEGVLCDTEINECASTPCQNGAICIDKFASYVCACSMGFSGINCEEEIMICADSPCSNQALCLMEEDNPTCYCVPDFHGEWCESQYDECQLAPERCVNGGSCVDGVDEYFCSCAPGFSGRNCECVILEEEGQIYLDCNYTWAFNNLTMLDHTFSSIVETVFSTTENALDSSIEIENTSNPTHYPKTDSTPFVYLYTDGNLQVTIDSSITTDKPYHPADIQNTSPAAVTQYTTAYIEETVIENSSFNDPTSRTRETELTEPSIEEDIQNITTILPYGNTSDEMADESHGTSDEYFSRVDYITKVTLSTPFDDGSTVLSTQYSSDSLSELSSFFTETPTDKPSNFSPVPDEDQITTFSSANAISFDQNLITTGSSQIFTTGSGEKIETTMTPIGMSRPPGVVKECSETVCANGGTCAMTTNGVRCHCGFRYAGPFCDIPISLENAAFSTDSFIRHNIYQHDKAIDASVTPNPAILKQLNSMTVRFKAKLTSREGLILLATAEGDEGNHYIALFLHNGLLQFQFSCGVQTMLLSEIEGTINNGFEMNIKVQLNFNEKYSHCNASLHVNETLAMNGEQPTWLINVPNLLKQGRERALASIRQIWLHLGGRPIKTMYTLSHNISRYHGFTGCIHELEINHTPVAIFDNAQDVHKILECTSLACLSNPCRNRAVCVEDESDELERRFSISPQSGAVGKWSCKCAFGYIGKTCERSICDNNPCRFGGTCVIFPESGYLCLCPYGKHGHLCEHDLDILQPSFFGSIQGISSYVAYPITFPIEDRFEFSFKIIPTTTSQISLLAFIGQPTDHHDQSDHFSVSFIQGFILLTWNLGSGPRRIFTQETIQVQTTRPTTIQVGRNGRTAWLSIDGKSNISGNSPGSHTKLNVAPELYIGGHELGNFSSLPHDLPLHSGFQGCLFDIRLLAGQLHIPLHQIGGMRGRSVGQCGTKECHRHACQNNGACLQHGSTFTCICQEDWNGILCSQKVNPCEESINKCAIPDAVCFPLVSGYECDCPLGKVGVLCESNLLHLSDVSFSGRRSYLALRWPSHMILDAANNENKVHYEKIILHSNIVPHNRSILLKSIRELDKINDVLKVPPTSSDTEVYADGQVLTTRSENYRQLKIRQMSIELQLRPLSEKGLIIFVRTLDSKARQQGFISLSLQGGVVEYRVSFARLQTVVVRSNHVLAIGVWHSIRFAKFGKRLTLWVNGKGTSNIGSIREEYVSLSSELYLGGLPDLSSLPYDAISGYPVPFVGCIRGLTINETRITLDGTAIIASRNINDCDGTPCGGDICGRDGVCWLDELSQPHCKCPEHSKGVNCEIHESCEVVQCHNKGQCMRNGRCNCVVGWTGRFCEIATTKLTSIGFNDRSYILLPSKKIKIKDKRNEGSSLSWGKSSLELQLSFNISTLEDGLLVWSTDTAGRYFGTGIRDGFLVVASNIFLEAATTKENGGGKQWKAFVADGDWHNVFFETKASQLHLSVNGIVHFTGLQSNTILDNKRPAFGERILSDEIIYLGGFPDENIYNRTHGNFARSFNGCIQHIFVGNQQDELDVTAYEGANISECVV